MIELVAVIVVVTLLAASAAPALTSFDEARQAMAGRQLLRDMTYARQRAVATGARTWVVFDPDAGTWTILAEDPAHPGRAGASVITDAATGADFVQTMGTGAFAGIRITSARFDGAAEVGFDWLGRPLNAGEAPLAATGRAVLTGGHRVSVTTSTGHVSLARP